MRPLAVVFAALCFGGCATLSEEFLTGTAPTKPVEKREPITDPSRSREGAFHRFHVLMLAREVPEAAASQLLEKMKAKDPDELADDYIRSYDGARSAEITVNLARQSIGQAALASTMGRILSNIRMPDGTTVTLPVAQAYGAHLALMRATAETLRQRETWPNIGGRYAADVSGFCPFPAGAVQLTQKDYLVEVTRDGRLLLSGAVGRTRASLSPRRCDS